MSERIELTTDEFDLLNKINNADDAKAVELLYAYYEERGESVMEAFARFLEDEGLQDTEEGRRFSDLFAMTSQKILLNRLSDEMDRLKIALDDHVQTSFINNGLNTLDFSTNPDGSRFVKLPVDTLVQALGDQQEGYALLSMLMRGQADNTIGVKGFTEFHPFGTLQKKEFLTRYSFASNLIFKFTEFQAPSKVGYLHPTDYLKFWDALFEIRNAENEVKANEFNEEKKHL